MKPNQHVVVFEDAPENRAAYVPDLPGCGLEVPGPGTWTTPVEVA